MWKKFVFINISAFLLLSFQAFAEDSRFPEVPRISAILAFHKYQSGKAILIDTMDAKTYSKKRALGSINIPNGGPQDRARAREMALPFSPEQEIIVYCD